MSENKRPNLFDFATSELSQDAFICWALSWLEEDKFENEEMRAFAFEMLKLLSGKKIIKEEVYDQIKIYKQHNKVDVVVHFKSLNWLLLIEDKIHGKDNITKQESYKKNFLHDKEFEISEDQILFAYLKTGHIDSRDKDLIKKIKNIKLVDIDDLNNLLNKYDIDNHIFQDYKNHINQKVNEKEDAWNDLFNKNEYESLKKHIGQSILARYLKKECGIKNVNGSECYTKVANSKGGQPWIELWITSNDEWEFEDAIFYRIEPVTRNGDKVPAITLRQYKNGFSKKKDKQILLDKRERYKNLVKAFSKFSGDLPFTAKTKYTSPDYYSTVFGTILFDEGDGDLAIFCKKFKEFHLQFIHSLDSAI